MENLHKKLVKKNKHYANWHTRSGHQIIQWVVLVLVMIAVTSVFYLRVQTPEEDMNLTGVSAGASQIESYWADQEKAIVRRSKTINGTKPKSFEKTSVMNTPETKADWKEKPG